MRKIKQTLSSDRFFQNTASHIGGWLTRTNQDGSVSSRHPRPPSCTLLDRLVTGVLCRMQNGLYGQRYQCKAKRDARSLSRSEIDKDGTLLIGFQDYKSENNKGK